MVLLFLCQNLDEDDIKKELLVLQDERHHYEMRAKVLLFVSVEVVNTSCVFMYNDKKYLSETWASRVKLGMFLLLLVLLIFYVRKTMLYCSFLLESFNSKNWVTFFPYGVSKITIIGSNCTTQLRQCIHFFNFGCTPVARMNDPRSNNKSNKKNSIVGAYPHKLHPVTVV